MEIKKIIPRISILKVLILDFRSELKKIKRWQIIRNDMKEEITKFQFMFWYKNFQIIKLFHVFVPRISTLLKNFTRWNFPIKINFYEFFISFSFYLIVIQKSLIIKKNCLFCKIGKKWTQSYRKKIDFFFHMLVIFGVQSPVLVKSQFFLMQFFIKYN